MVINSDLSVYFLAYSKNLSKLNKGFSLIEVLVCMSIIAILATFSVRSIYQYKANQLLLTIAQQYYFALHKGLNMSLLNRQSLILTTLFQQKDSISNGLVDGHSATQSSWQNGLSIFEYDSNVTISDQTYTINSLIYSYHNNHLTEKITIDLKSSLNKPYLIFYETGALWPNGRFIFCHKDYQSGYEISFSQLGNIQFSKNNNDCV